MSTPEFIGTAVAVLTDLERQIRHWTDPNTQRLYGCGPDAARKFDLVKDAVEGFGYALELGEDRRYSARFDWRAADALHIPEAEWPEYAREEKKRDAEGCEPEEEP